MSVLLFAVACQPQDSVATRRTSEVSPSPVRSVATETVPALAAGPSPVAEATSTATPAAPTSRPQPTATPKAAAATMTAVPTPRSRDRPQVTVGNATFATEIANTVELRTKGLSERDSLDSQTGMLFIFSDGIASAFWMKGMRFPLDFVWIGHECTVVDVTENVPNAAPGTDNSSLPIYRSSVEAEYNLEINAGEVEKLGISVGDAVTFEQFDVQGANC